MSDRWPGGIISKTPVIPTGPSDTGSAPGIWTMDQASYWIKQGLWPTQILRDPYFPYVTMLLSTTSTNGGQNNTFLDSSTNNFTFTNVNTPTQGSFSPYGSNWSGYFDGSGDYLSIPYTTANFDWWTSDFTIEAWVFPSSLSSWQDAQGFPNMVGNVSPTTVTNYWSFGPISNGTVRFFYFNGSTNSVTSSATLAANTWSHVAMTKTSSGITIFVNGVASTTTAISGTPQSSTGTNLIIGAYNGAYANGYVSNLRIVKGTAVYSGNFTPPTSPLTAVTNTKLLTCAYNRFRDGSTNNLTVTATGDTKTTDFSPFAPASPYSAATNGGSLVFNGSNEATYVDSSNAALTLGTGDFTIELWVYQRVLGGAQSWVSTYGGPGSGYRFSPTNTMQFSWGDSDVLTSSATPDINQWCHVAVTRSGSTVRIFKNGVVVATGTNSTDLTGGSTQTTLGRIPTYNQWYYNGYMSDVRIVKGTAVYTADFTPPTAPLTAISGTSLLARGTNANIFDAASMNDMRTAADAQVSTSVKKFDPSSIYIPGRTNNPYLITNPVVAGYGIGTGNFTYEAFVYLTGTDNWQAFFEGRTGGGYYMGVNQSTRNPYVIGSDGFTLNASPATIPLNTWTHMAYVRNNGILKIYLDGTEVASGSTTVNVGSTYIAIGGDPGNLAMNGYMDEVRITAGVARYTSNFTPPTAAFPTA